MTRPFFAMLLLVCALLIAPVVWASKASAKPQANPGNENVDAAAQLARQLAPLKNFSAQFQQTLYSADDYPMQKSDGEMEVARPGKMRWISNPPMEQWVIANGEKLWVYDPDLEQVTVKPFLEDIGNTPAMLFVGALDHIGDDYFVVIHRDADEITYALTPRAQHSLYRKVALTFRGVLPSAIVLWDGMGQRTNVTLTMVEANRSIDPGDFEFVIPEGTDIFSDE